MEIREKVKKILFEVPSPPESPILAGATDEAISNFERTTDLIILENLKVWLLFSNDSLTGPGGIYGLVDSYINIIDIYEYYPGWQSSKWIPIAGDGFGNHYLVDANENSKDLGVVLFVDTTIDLDKPTYLVASNVWFFFYFLLSRELGNNKWPFNRDYTGMKVVLG